MKEITEWMNYLYKVRYKDVDPSKRINKDHIYTIAKFMCNGYTKK